MRVFSSVYLYIICLCTDTYVRVQFNMLAGLDLFELNILRHFLGVHKFAANDFVLGESGWVSCCGRHQLAALRLWNRLTSLSPDRLTAQIFAWDLSFSDIPGSWPNVVNQTVNDVSQPRVFENIEICDLEQAYDILLNYENTKWNTSRYNKQKLRHYNMYKYSLETENYLFFNIPKYHRSILPSSEPVYCHWILKPADTVM